MTFQFAQEEQKHGQFAENRDLSVGPERLGERLQKQGELLSVGCCKLPAS